MAFLVEQLSACFNLRFALNKFAVTGSGRELVESAKVQLGPYAGEFNPTILNLGVDFAPGKNKNASEAKDKQKERWRKGKDNPRMSKTKIWFVEPNLPRPMERRWRGGVPERSVV